jgi:hypothetical protein
VIQISPQDAAARPVRLFRSVVPLPSPENVRNLLVGRAATGSLTLAGTQAKISQRTVERNWRFARAWLKNEMGKY